MYKLDLGFHNEVVYRGCRVTEFEVGKFNLETPIDSAIVIVEANLKSLLETIPEAERDTLVLTGTTRPQILLKAQIIFGPAFRKTEYFDGKRGASTVIHDPFAFDGEPE